MKKILILVFGFTFSQAILYSQAPPQAFSFKAVITKNGSLIVNKTIYLQISILQNSTGGNAVYVEKFTPTTNSAGQVDIEIGRGIPVIGTFSSIGWSQASYYLKIEYTLRPNTVYTTLSTNQLLSVPYALYAGDAGNGFASLWNGNGIPSGIESCRQSSTGY